MQIAVGAANFEKSDYLSRVAALGLAGCLLIIAAPASAQATTNPAASLGQLDPSVCVAQKSTAFGSAIGNGQPVVAICGNKAVTLGTPEEFQTYSNKTLGAVVVDMRQGGRRTILLVSPQVGRGPLVEDISGQIALSVGRGPLSRLDGIDIDLTGFAVNGTLGVRGRPEENGGTAKTAAINLAQQIAQARAVRSASAAQQ